GGRTLVDHPTGGHDDYATAFALATVQTAHQPVRPWAQSLGHRGGTIIGSGSFCMAGAAGGGRGGPALFRGLLQGPRLPPPPPPARTRRPLLGAWGTPGWPQRLSSIPRFRPRHAADTAGRYPTGKGVAPSRTVCTSGLGVWLRATRRRSRGREPDQRNAGKTV